MCKCENVEMPARLKGRSDGCKLNVINATM